MEGKGDGFGVLDRDAVRNDPKAYGILPLPHKHSGQTYDMGYLETVIDEEMAEIDNSMPVVDYLFRIRLSEMSLWLISEPVVLGALKKIYLETAKNN